MSAVPAPLTLTVEVTISFTEQSAIPLTTIFTPGTDCTGNGAYKARTVHNEVYYEIEDGADKTTCYPPSYRENHHDTTSYYYPGVCPLSYVYLWTSISRLANAPDTTFAKCCPPGITQLADNWSCQQSLTTHVTITNPTDSQTTVYSTTYWANPFYVAWQDSDVSRFSPQSEVRAAFQSAGLKFPTSTESSSSTFETQDEDSQSGSGGLSNGAIAGIGVVAGIIGLIAIVAIWWFVKRYRVSRRTKNVDERGQSGEEQIYETPSTTKPSQQIYEAPDTTTASQKIHEAPNDTKAHQEIHEAPDDTKAHQEIHEAPDTTKPADEVDEVPKYELQG